MKKMYTLVPKPASRFLKIACEQCDTERIVYSHTTIDISCKTCGALLAERSGGKAIIHSKKVQELEN